MLGRFCFFSFPPGVGFATTGGLWACGSCPFLHAPFSDFIFMGFIQDSPCWYCLDFQAVSGLSGIGSFVPRVFPCVQHLRLCTGAGFVAVSFEIAFPWLYLPLAVILCWFLGSCWLGSLPCLGGFCLPDYCVDLAYCWF